MLVSLSVIATKEWDIFTKVKCKVFNNTRKHYFHANTMKDLFKNDVLLFLKETGLHQKIKTCLLSWRHNKQINWKQIVAE